LVIFSDVYRITRYRREEAVKASMFKVF